jgi:predicted protein tyrosine phosphatase
MYPYRLSKNHFSNIEIKQIELNEFYTISQITPNIYLSGFMIASNKEELNKFNIKSIINCAKTLPNYFPDDFTYTNIPIDDTWGQNIEHYFDSSYNVIESIIGKNENILVHCHAGISRSATIVIAYLMRKNNWSLDQALAFVRSKRSIVNPNLDFIESLKISNK